LHDLTVPARKRIGVLTPSSNTALEPLVSAMLSRVSGVSVHYSRFGVTEISLRQHSLAQFDDSKILEAVRLLADARVDVIGWSAGHQGSTGALGTFNLHLTRNSSRHCATD
jgi:maleate isomerase